MPEEKKQATVEALAAEIHRMIPALRKACRKDRNVAYEDCAFALEELLKRHGLEAPATQATDELVLDVLIDAVQRNRRGLRTLLAGL